MTKITLIGVAAATMAVVGSANAADMALKAPLLAPIAYTWTGCYVGGNAGVGWGQKTFQDASGNALIDSTGGGRSVNDNLVGGIGGGQVGCDYQFSPHYVIGVQGNFDAANINGSVLDTLETSFPLNINAKADSLFGAVARLGYTGGAWLVYVDGGAAWVHDSYSITASTTLPGVVAPSYTQPSETRTGGVVGFGAEYYVLPNLSVFGEFDHYFFGTRSLPFTCTGTCGGTTQFVNITQDISSFRIGVNWRFGNLMLPH